MLIILATISINAVMGEDGLIKRAEKASQMHANSVASESDAMDELLYQMGVATGENLYDPDAWLYAWVCENGVWGDKLERGVTIPEGEGIVVAKIYETSKKITPVIDFGEGPITFTEGNECVMIIEGKGEIGALIDDNGEYAWTKELFSFIFEETQTIPIALYTSEVIISEDITSIGDYAFCYCSSLTSITIPNNVIATGEEVFVECTNLKNVTICKIVERGANDILNNGLSHPFDDCTNLNVTLPDDVTSIENFAFWGWTSLTSITIPDSVTSIGYSAFSNCSSLTSITIPDSVTTIGDYAFGHCTSLTSVTIGNSVTTIGDYAFVYCTSLTSVTIGNSVTTIGDYAFVNCSSLTSVTIGNSVTSIGDNAFDNCSSLTSITIPDSVTSIGISAFLYCNKLAVIKMYNTNPATFGADAFGNSSSKSNDINGENIYGNIAPNSTIYVLSEDVKTALTGAYETSYTTVQVVTLDEMNAI